MNHTQTIVPPTGPDADPTTTEPAGAAPRAVSRRAIFAPAASLAAILQGVSASRASAQNNDASADVDPGSMTDRLVDRITIGATVEDRDLAASMGFDDYLEMQLDPGSIDDSACDAQLAQFPLIELTPHDAYQLETSQSVHINQLIDSTIIRTICSKRTLLERMAEFYTDHFNSFALAQGVGFFKNTENRAIRDNALAPFKTALTANAQTGAMLAYLNQAASSCPNPNENYAREVMELHTMGVGGGYTEDDVVQVARCFTGWSSTGGTANTNWGLFQYKSNQHCDGDKVVLGETILEKTGAAGEDEGHEVLDILASHPSTASYISGKLARWFLGESCRNSVIAEATAAYKCTNGNIKAVLRAILQPNNLYDAPPRYKRPFHLYAHAMRATGATIGTIDNSLRNHYRAAGQLPFHWGPPDGYPDTFAFWSGLVLPRWNFGASLMNNQITNVSVDVNAFFEAPTPTGDEAIDTINQKLFGGALPACEQGALRAYLPPAPILPNAQQKQEVIGLAIGSQSFQWY